MLDGVDTAIIEQAKRDNDEFRQLLEEHEAYEAQLLNFIESGYLSSEQEVERKRLQKLKLVGKDRMMEILSQYEKA